MERLQIGYLRPKEVVIRRIKHMQRTIHMINIDGIVKLYISFNPHKTETFLL